MVKNHPEKIGNIKTKISELVDDMVLVNCRPIFSEKFTSNYFKKLAAELSKNKTYQFDYISAMFACLDSITYYSRHIIDLSQQEIYYKELAQKDKDELLDFVCNYLMSIPFSYDIKIPLNNIPLPPFSLGRRLIIEQDVKALPSIGFALSGDSKFVNTNICVPTTGYYNIYEKDHFMKEATIVLSVLIYSLRERGLIKRNYQKSARYTSALSPIFNKKHQVSEYSAKIYNKDYPNSIDDYSFPIPVCMYLEELGVTDEISEDEVKRLALEVLQETTKLLDDSTDEAQNIVSAIDWCIQSEINTDKTMSFLQTCMGLEALLGDNNNDAGLTLTLTDRCAYLIGRGMVERAEIKKEFKAIYQLRSKLVHGRMNKISTQDRELCRKAIRYLKRAISKELSYLMEIK